ncbi:MAG: CRISPR-associated protein Cas4 [Candidatus Hadarchaeum sp.]|uniref:CRISPR-associated protein Cas4 n=1 Tax=Candidatus Hadarchaeum sp. TaxID=2883567 RepID=UPI003181C0A3
MRDSGRDGDISAWEVFQYFYCQRKLYFIRKLSIYPPERKKMVAGSEDHFLEQKRVKRRKTIYGFPGEEVEGILKDIVMESERLGLYGRADTVVKLKNGEMVPVETKHSSLKTVTLPWRKQLVAYALLLDEKFGTQVKRGLIYLLPARLIIEVGITGDDKLALIRDLDRMRKLIDSDTVPQKVNIDKCGYCEVMKFCRNL